MLLQSVQCLLGTECRPRIMSNIAQFKKACYYFSNTISHQAWSSRSVGLSLQLQLHVKNISFIPEYSICWQNVVFAWERGTPRSTSGMRLQGLSDCVLLDWKPSEVELRTGKAWQLKLVTEQRRNSHKSQPNGNRNSKQVFFLLLQFQFPSSPSHTHFVILCDFLLPLLLFSLSVLSSC